MGMFGSIQVATILCSIVRTKLVAVWIGAMGMGLFTLFNNAVDLVISITSLGIRNSSVRDMAIASESHSKERIGQMVAVIRKWSWFVSILGAVVVLSFAPVLSRTAFGNADHTWDFLLLASVMMFNGLANGELSILQGSSMMRRLAHASMWGVVSGLLISIPLFYFLREKSIIPSIIAYNAMTLLFAYLFRFKDFTPAKLTAKEAFSKGKEFAKLGIFMTLSGFITSLASYIFAAYLNRTAGIEEVGFYQAGFVLVNKYAGLIFTAIGMEYYPRLARIHESKKRIHAFVSQEINIAMLALLPIIALFLIFREWVVSILYTEEFHEIIPFISWAMVGTVFRAYSWCMAYVILAKGDGKTFIMTESASVAIGLGLNILFYHFYGLTGLGISYIAWYACYCVIIGIAYFRRYRFTISLGSSITSLLAFAGSMAVLALMETGQILLAATAAVLFSFLCIRRIYRLTYSRI